MQYRTVWNQFNKGLFSYIRNSYFNCTSNDSFMVFPRSEVVLSHVYFTLFAPLRTLGSAKGNKKKLIIILSTSLPTKAISFFFLSVEVVLKYLNHKLSYDLLTFVTKFVTKIRFLTWDQTEKKIPLGILFVNSLRITTLLEPYWPIWIATTSSSNVCC